MSISYYTDDTENNMLKKHKDCPLLKTLSIWDTEPRRCWSGINLKTPLWGLAYMVPEDTKKFPKEEINQ